MAENEILENENSDEELDMAAAMGMDSSAMDQGDIDKLMGDQSGSQERQFNNLIENMIYMSMLNYERLPMLDVIFDRFMLTLTTSMKAQTSANADIQIKGIEYKSFSKCMNALPVPGILAISNANPWSGNIIVALDAPFLYSALEIMLGGRRATPAPADGRNFTSIERKVGAKLVNVILKDLELAFNPLTDVQFIIDRIETNPQFATIAQPNAPSVHIKMQITLDGRKGTVDIVMPYSTIESVRKLLSKVFFGEKLGGDPTWKSHLTNQVESSKVTLKTVFHELETSLNNTLKWKVGDTLNLSVDSNHEATMYWGETPMFTGKIGKTKKDKMAVRIVKDLDNKDRMKDDFDLN